MPVLLCRLLRANCTNHLSFESQPALIQLYISHVSKVFLIFSQLQLSSEVRVPSQDWHVMWPAEPLCACSCRPMQVWGDPSTFDIRRCVALGNAIEGMAGGSCGAGLESGCLSQTSPTICHPSDVSLPGGTPGRPAPLCPLINHTPLLFLRST